MIERTKILSQSEKTSLWGACMGRIKQLEEGLSNIDSKDSFLVKHLTEALTEEISLLGKLGEDILCAVEIQIRTEENDDNPPWDP